MASLERSQGQHNAHISNSANVSASNDPQTQITDANKLRHGAELLAAAKTLGMDEDQLFSWLNSRRELAPNQRNGSEAASVHVSPSQKLAQLTATLAELPTAEPDGARTVSNEQADLLLAGGEQTQDTVQNFGGFDPKTGRQKDYNKGAEEIAMARGGSRDLNAFSVSVPIPGTSPKEYRQRDVYIEDGRPTPASFRQSAILRDAGIGRGDLIGEFKEDVEIRPKGGLQGAIETQSRKRKVYAANLDNQRPGGTRSTAPANALERLLSQIDSGEVDINGTVDIDNPVTGKQSVNVADLVKRLRAGAPRTEGGVDVQQRAEVRAERERGRQAVREDSQRFSTIEGIKNQLAYEAEYEALKNGAGRNPNGQQGSVNIARMGETPLPGGLTAAKSTTGSYYSAAQSALSREAMARRPEAIQLDGDARAVAQSLGLSEYVDSTDTDRSIPTAGVGTAGEALNAPGPELTRTGRFIAEHAYEPKGQDAQLQQANISQAQADWSRGVEAHAPGYRHKPVTSIEDLDTQISRVISARQEAGKPFYIKGEKDARGRVRNKRVDDPGIAEVLQLFRMGPQDQQNLANAIYQQELGRSQQVTGPQPRGISTSGDRVQTGTMFGSEDMDLTRARDSQAARFSSIPDFVTDKITGERIDTRDAQMPFIASQGNKETPRSRMVTKDPATGKARTPDQAVEAYAQQRAQNKKPVDPIYAAKIRRDNAGLRADQAALEENQSVNRVIRQADASQGNLHAQRSTFASQEKYGFSGDISRGADRSKGGAIVPTTVAAPAPTAQATQPTQYYDGGSAQYDVATRFGERMPTTGSNGVKPPSGPTISAATPAPEPNNNAVSRALKTEIIARLDQKQRARRRNIGGGAAATGGLAALIGAFNGGQQEDQF